MSEHVDHSRKPLGLPIGVTADGMLGKRALKNLASLDRVDAMSPEMRHLVQEFGLPIVDACLDSGITNPATIRHLVNTVWAGARSSFQNESRASAAPKAQADLDWLLIQAGAQITAARLVRFLWDRGQLAIVPSCFNDNHPATLASMETVSNHDRRVTKGQKHALRLTAGIRAAALSLWPSLRGGQA